MKPIKILALNSFVPNDPKTFHCLTKNGVYFPNIHVPSTSLQRSCNHSMAFFVSGKKLATEKTTATCVLLSHQNPPAGFIVSITYSCTTILMLNWASVRIYAFPPKGMTLELKSTIPVLMLNIVGK